MKPTKMRNQMIYRASYQTKSKQLGSALSKDLHKKYGKKSVRVIEGDSVTILRGEFKGVDGKVSEVSTEKSSVAIEGVKKEKTKGDKFDVFIHTSNLVVTSLNTEDKWRMAKLEGKNPSKQPKETKVVKESEKKEDEK
jgi:large subunit ribosomal protein L24